MASKSPLERQSASISGQKSVSAPFRVFRELISDFLLYALPKNSETMNPRTLIPASWLPNSHPH